MERMKALTASVLSCAAVVVSAQSPAAPAFDAASVKVNVARRGIRGHSYPGDRFEAVNVPLRDLLMVAYGEAGIALPEFLLTGGPGWIDTDRFDISATVGRGRPNTVAQKQVMLRTLLAERFKLALHAESKDLPIYALTIARKDGALGSQLHHADADCEPEMASQPGRREGCIFYALPSGLLMLRGQTMSGLANGLTRLLGKVVRDRTGLAGGFDADGRFNPEGLPGTLPAKIGETLYPSEISVQGGEMNH
jgi:uncharacterized protein (TIGR03435 family)